MLSRRDVLGSSLVLLAGGVASATAKAQESNTYGAALTGLGDHERARPFPLGHSLRGPLARGAAPG